MSLAIKVGGYRLNLPPRTTMRAEISSLLFAQDLELSELVFPITVSSRDNPPIISLCNHLDTESPLSNADAEIYFHGELLYTASASRAKATDTTVTINLRIALSSFRVFEKKLSELPLGGEVIIGASSDEVVLYAKTTSQDVYPNVNCAFPTVRNPDFYGEINPDFLGVINDYDTATEKYFKNVSTNKYCLVPHVYLAYIMKQAITDAGLLSGGDFLSDAVVKKLIVSNNRALDGETSRPSFVRASLSADLAIYDNDLFRMTDDTTAPNMDVSGNYNTVNGEYNCMNTSTYRFSAHVKINTALYPIIPPFRIYIEVIRNGFTIDFYLAGTVTVGGDTELDLLPHIAAATATDKLTYQISLVTPSGTPLLNWTLKAGTYATYQDAAELMLNEYSHTMNLANHVPDITVGELFRSIKILYNVAMDFDLITNELLLSFAKTKLAEDIIDLTPYLDDKFEITDEDNSVKDFNFEWPSDDALVNDNFKDTEFLASPLAVATYADLPSPDYPKQITFILSENKYYIVIFDDTPALVWVPYSDNYYPRTINPDGKTSVTTPACPQFLETLSDRRLALSIRQPGTSFAFNIKNPITSIRLSYYQGFLAYPGGSVNVPTATPGMFDAAGASSFNMPITWDNQWDDPPEDLYTEWHVCSIDYRSSSFYVRRKFFPPYYVIREFDIYRIYRIYNKHVLIRKLNNEIGDEFSSEIEYVQAKTTFRKI